MADTSIVNDKTIVLQAAHQTNTPMQFKGALWDTSRDADMLTVGDHAVIEIPVGMALHSFFVYVITTFTSGGAPTMQFKHGAAGDSYTGLVPLAQLTKGSGWWSGAMAVGGTANYTDAWAHTTAWNLSIETATAAYTAGALVVGAYLIDVQTLVDRFGL